MIGSRGILAGNLRKGDVIGLWGNQWEVETVRWYAVRVRALDGRRAGLVVEIAANDRVKLVERRAA